ncbi:flagellar assembly peptidoglycan hydrolase FlgJ [Xylophilus sp. GOD-11R]|uniref:flagellar assembly peptidoglycan hydrolase FlgJ n=1 Tax=Xylophilus sp. GOD-11R TaxID=3089814 RepID=UPI00298C9C76|nr:flagellar assembly peptidoglycan hydrolase FlgJ [Xylophilus sp. GOD-11R]WPB57735.1 flagellar assembly peptidoglycan hydrolase FlgJ [Xylophilus sp. GOD-11R]
MAISSTSFGMGSGAPSASEALAADGKSLNALKFQAGKNDPKAIKESAKQFESMFMRELMKSMREATMKSGMNDSEGEKLGMDMLDQQFAVQMSGQPGGLSAMIEKQLMAQSGLKPGTLPPSTLSLGAVNGAKPANATSATAPVKTGSAQGDFVARLGDAAATVSEESGIPANFMLGQAGHETGWGKHLIRNKDGSSANNLFGVKAGGDWKGKVAEVTTTEYINGQPRKVVAKFRAYESAEDSFRDYAKLINESPRYANARQKTDSAHAYATELKRAGYATDPAYASKLSRAIASAAHWQQRSVVASAGQHS